MISINVKIDLFDKGMETSPVEARNKAAALLMDGMRGCHDNLGYSIQNIEYSGKDLNELGGGSEGQETK